MSDTFLDLHLVKRLRFTISGSISPISIRDQMVRAKMFVDSAISAGLISARRPLFVAGAGVGGVTAAIYAVQQGIETTLVEREAFPFRLQLQCLTRWIDPTQYDWPATHWSTGTYPWDTGGSGGRLPLSWSAEVASLVAMRWHRELRWVMDCYPKLLHVSFETEYLGTNKPRGRELLKVTYGEKLPKGQQRMASAPVKVDKFGAMLDARGFGGEKIQVPGSDYQGIEFWKPDMYEQANLGLGTSSEPWKVLICGDGDGALQDVLRVATGERSAEQILRRLQPYLDRELLLQLYSEEDQGFRAKGWIDKKENHATQMRLDAVHRGIALGMLEERNKSEEKRSLAVRLKEELAKLLEHSKGVDLRLIHPCDHFTGLYPLNRFLVYLIWEFVRSTRRSGFTITPRMCTAKVACAGHDFENAMRCHGKKHGVALRNASDCTDLSVTDGSKESREYDVVILRFGLVRPPHLDRIAGLNFCLPYLSPL